MSGGLQVNTGNMNQNGLTTVSNADYFQTELASLRSNIETLMTIWKGVAANEFNKSYEDQAQNLNNFQTLLNDLGESISKAAGILNDTEEENASAGARLF